MPRAKEPTSHSVGTTHFPRRRHASRPEPAQAEPTGGHDEMDDADEDFELERGDPTFDAPLVPKGDVDLGDVGEEEAVEYGGDTSDKEQPKATYDPADEDDDSQGI